MIEIGEDEVIIKVPQQETLSFIATGGPEDPITVYCSSDMTFEMKGEDLDKLTEALVNFRNSGFFNQEYKRKETY